MQPKYQIGDEVWFAKFESAEASIVCPDCGGTKYVTMEMFDGARHTLDCEGCKVGFEGPRGRITTWQRKPVAEPVRVSSVSIEADKIEYRVNGGWIAAEDRLFLTKEEAMVRADEVAADAMREEGERLQRKAKADRSWAWHVHYHRRCVRQAEKDIAYHTSKLAVARTKSKEPEAA